MVTDPKQAFSDRLNEALDDNRFPPKGEGRQLAVAKTFGVSQKGARKWLEAEAIPHTKRLDEIAQRLSITVEWLLSGKEPKNPGMANVEPGPDLHPVPLISWVKAGNWSGVEDPYRVGDAERPVYTTRKVGPRAYALRVVGESMSPKFPPGCIIVVDPDRSPDHGSPVIVRQVDSKEATFKLLMYDGDAKYLKPINSAYPTLLLDKSSVLAGVIVQMFMDVD